MVSSFAVVAPAPVSLRASTGTRSSMFFSSSSSIPEPGPCPECTDENTYWDGSTLFVCTNCDHEWSSSIVVDSEKGNGDDDADAATTDINGNVLEQGDMCVLTQDLAKGKLKKGLKVKIRLGDYGGGHDCEATIKGVGTYALKTKFLKKV
jgi:alkylphosphonate utilization operon protein PhnA